MTAPGDLDALTALPEDELLTLLGEDLFGDGRGIGSRTPEHWRNLARRWLEDRRDEVADRVCGLPAVQALTSDAGDKVAEAAVVADALAASLGRPSASIVAVILVRRGLDRLCGGPTVRNP